MKKHEILEIIERLVEETKTAVLATVDGEGRPHMRWMVPALLRGRAGAIYTVSGPGTPKIEHLASRPQVEWMLQSRSLDRIVTVRGRAQVVDELSIKREILETVGRRLAAFWKYNEDPSQLVVIETIAEDLLATFRQAPLLDAYDVYQHLMDYWAETMQDDAYLIAADGWVRGVQPREVVQVKNKNKKLTLCGKTNVLTYAFDLWERAFHEIGKQEFPDIQRDYAHVDATTMWFVKNPEWFDVIVTDNMFGDIITDLGAMIQGGMGIAAGGNINPETVSMFEPIGGSAPKYTGQGVINPMAAIAAGQMLLAHLGEQKAAAGVEHAMVEVMSQKLKSMAAGKMGYSTGQVGDLVADAVARSAR